MNERDYILATNCARLQAARDLLSMVLGGDNYGILPKKLRLVQAYVAEMSEDTFKAMNGKDDE